MQGGGAGGAPSCGRRGRAAPWDAAAERGNAALSSPGTRRQRGGVGTPNLPAPPASPRPGPGPPTRRRTNPGVVGGGAGRAGNGAPGPAPPDPSSPAPLGSSGGAGGRRSGRAPPHLPRFILDGGVSSGSLFARPPRPAFLRAAGRGGAMRAGTPRGRRPGEPHRAPMAASAAALRTATPAHAAGAHGARRDRTHGMHACDARCGAGAGRGRCGVRAGSAATHGPIAPRAAPDPPAPVVVATAL